MENKSHGLFGKMCKSCGLIKKGVKYAKCRKCKNLHIKQYEGG